MALTAQQKRARNAAYQARWREKREALAPSRPDLGERWPSRLVATAAESRLNI
jgi:hypothetical protein